MIKTLAELVVDWKRHTITSLLNKLAADKPLTKYPGWWEPLYPENMDYVINNLRQTLGMPGVNIKKETMDFKRERLYEAVGMLRDSGLAGWEKYFPGGVDNIPDKSIDTTYDLVVRTFHKKPGDPEPPHPFGVFLGKISKEECIEGTDYLIRSAMSGVWHVAPYINGEFLVDREDGGSACNPLEIYRLPT